jgi:hypothetical protein
VERRGGLEAEDATHTGDNVVLAFSLCLVIVPLEERARGLVHYISLGIEGGVRKERKKRGAPLKRVSVVLAEKLCPLFFFFSFFSIQKVVIS